MTSNNFKALISSILPESNNNNKYVFSSISSSSISLNDFSILTSADYGYLPHAWENGEIVNEDKMNNLEQGILIATLQAMNTNNLIDAASIKLIETYSEQPISAQNTTFIAPTSTENNHFIFTPIETFSPEFNVFENAHLDLSNGNISYSSTNNLFLYFFHIPYYGFTIKSKIKRADIIDRIPNDTSDTTIILKENLKPSSANAEPMEYTFNQPKGTIVLLEVGAGSKDNNKSGLLVKGYNSFEIPKLNLNNFQDSFKKYISTDENSEINDLGNDLLNIQILDNTYIASNRSNQVISSTDNSSFHVKYFQVPVSKLTIKYINGSAYCVAGCSPNNSNTNCYENQILYDSGSTNTFDAYYGEWVYISYTNDNFKIETDLLAPFTLPNLSFTSDQIDSITELPNLSLTTAQINSVKSNIYDPNNYYKIKKEYVANHNKTNYFIEIYFPNGNHYVKYTLIKSSSNNINADTWQLGTIYGTDDLNDTNIVALTGPTEFEMAMKLIDEITKNETAIKNFLIDEWIQYSFSLGALSATFPNSFTTNGSNYTGTPITVTFNNATELANYIYGKMTESRLPYDYSGGYNHGDEISNEGAFQLFIDGKWLNNTTTIDSLADEQLHIFNTIEAYDVSTDYISSDSPAMESVFPITSVENLEKYLNLLYTVKNNGTITGPDSFYHYYGWYEYYKYKNSYYAQHGSYPSEEQIKENFKFLEHKKSWKFENSSVKVKQSVKFLKTEDISGGLLCMFGGIRRYFPYKRRYSNHGKKIDGVYVPIGIIPDIEQFSDFSSTTHKLPTIYGNEIDYLYFGPCATARITCKYDNPDTNTEESDSNITQFSATKTVNQQIVENPDGMDKIYYTYYTSAHGTTVPQGTILNSEYKFEIHYSGYNQ